MRYMHDAIRANAASLVPLNPGMVAIYLTGSTDIRWTSNEVALFPHAEFVRIDQGGATSPQYQATVCDVESGAWDAGRAQSDFLVNCTAERPTIYCNRSTLPQITADCDIWLAAPDLTDQQAIQMRLNDKRIVAVQNLWNSNYDRSVVIDPFWPVKPPVTESPVSAGIQGGWLFCRKCGSLVHGPEATRLPCSGGGTHDPRSHDYFLPWNDKG